MNFLAILFILIGGSSIGYILYLMKIDKTISKALEKFTENKTLSGAEYKALKKLLPYLIIFMFSMTMASIL